MTDLPVPVVIDAGDPLLDAFVLQHDLRERFFHALKDVEAVFGGLDNDATEQDIDYALVQISITVNNAISPEAIKEWQDEGRPLPWLDERLGDEPEKVRQAVRKMIGLEGEQ